MPLRVKQNCPYICTDQCTSVFSYLFYCHFVMVYGVEVEMKKYNLLWVYIGWISVRLAVKLIIKALERFLPASVNQITETSRKLRKDFPKNPQLSCGCWRILTLRYKYVICKSYLPQWIYYKGYNAMKTPCLLVESTGVYNFRRVTSFLDLFSCNTATLCTLR